MTTTGKRRRKTGTTRVTTTRTVKPFRTPRFIGPRQRSSVIPGLLRQTGSEKKVIFTGTADAINGAMVLNTTGLISCINLIQVGSSMFNRIGRKIEMRSIRLTCHIGIFTQTVATHSPDYARVVVIYDRQTNGALPTLNDMFQDTEQSNANTSDALSALNMNNRERFVTIIDKRFILPQMTNTAGVATNVYPTDTTQCPLAIDEFRKLRGLTTHYKADSNPAGIGDVATGGLYFVTFTRQNASGAENHTGNWNCRLKYTDL